MTTNNKNKRTSSPLIKKLMADASPVERWKNKNRVEIACRIDDLIKEKKYSYKDFAKKVGKQPSEITKWVCGSHNFTTDILTEIAYALNVELQELFTENKPKVVYRTRIEVVAIQIDSNPYTNNPSSNIGYCLPSDITLNNLSKNNYA